MRQEVEVKGVQQNVRVRRRRKGEKEGIFVGHEKGNRKVVGKQGRIGGGGTKKWFSFRRECVGGWLEFGRSL